MSAETYRDDPPVIDVIRGLEYSHASCLVDHDTGVKSTCGKGQIPVVRRFGFYQAIFQ